MNAVFSLKIQKIASAIFLILLAGLVGLTLKRFDILAGGALIGFLLFLLIFLVVMENPTSAGFLLALVVPFERLPRLEVAGLSLKVSYIVIAGALSALFVRGFFRKNQPLKLSILDGFVLFFWLTQFLSLAISYNTGRSLLILGFLTLNMSVYFLLKAIISDRDKLNVLLRGVFWSAVIALVFAAFQFGGDLLGLPLELTGLKSGYDKGTFGFPRVHSFLSEPLYFANFLLPLIFLGGAIYLGKANDSAKKLIHDYFAWGLVAGVSVFFLILAISRGAYLGFLVGGVAFALFFFKKIFTPRVISILILAFTMLSGGVLFMLKASEGRALNEFVKHAKVQDFSQGESVQSRLKASADALKAYTVNPWQGIGLGLYGPFVDGFPSFTPKGGWKIVNNQYLETLAETGIIGLVGLVLLVLAVLARGLWLYYKTEDAFYKSFLAASFCFVLAMTVQYATFSTIYIYQIWFYLALAAVGQELVVRKIEVKK